MEVIKVDMKFFESHREINRIVNEAEANKHAVFQLKDKSYGISWNGLDEKPTVLKFRENVLIVAVSDTVVALDNTGSIKFKIGLNNPFNFLIENGPEFIIVTETTITIVNSNNFSISRFTGTPDIIEDVKIDGHKLIVKCLDNTYTI